MRSPSPRQLEALEAVAAGRFVPGLVREDDGWHARWRGLGGDGSADGWIDEYVRSAVVTRLSEDAEDQRHETLHDAWMMALRSRTGLVRADDAECAAFAAELREWQGAAEEDVAARAALAFELVQGPDGLSVVCDAPHGRRALRALGQAAFVFGPLRGLRRAADGRLAVALSRAEAESFVRGGAHDLAEAGYAVSGADVTAAVSAEAELLGGEAEPAGPVEVKLVVKVAGEPVSAEEVRFLLEQKSSVVFFRDRWIEVDRNVLKEALRALERAEGRRLAPATALGFALGLGAVGRLELERVRAHGWLRGLVNELAARRRAADGGAERLVPEGFVGELRAYQRRGVAWISFLADHGFGALLADDMGLGKTVQTIAWICLGVAGRRAAATPAPVLIVAPLTLLGNWRHEFAKFAPGLRVYVHQGENRARTRGFRLEAEAADVVVTGYSLLVRDHAAIRSVAWSALVLDEAQAVKNPDTQVARAARALGVRRRLALTGTPVENSVADVWALEEFLNPTFLGERKAFVERYVKPIAADERSRAADRLRRALEPFVLRRVKSDPEIAGELGEKREVKEYCALSPADRREYEAALEDYRAGERRQGDVFALITRLKLVCDGGGKLERLFGLLEDVFEAGESALVFTQYAKVGAVIRERLAKRFGRDFPFLHGALSAAERERQIESFRGEEGPSAFILSLRAGGFGLNLTKATHVIHFDRWWNPAVENQATDRAHRIGQAKTVFVHLFITEGTLEEHVDEILEFKSRVAGTLIEDGESFLRELDSKALLEVVSLDGEGGRDDV